MEKTQADGYRGGSEGSEGRSATVWKGVPLGGGEGGGSWTSLGGPGGKREAEKEGDMEEKGRGWGKSSRRNLIFSIRELNLSKICRVPSCLIHVLQGQASAGQAPVLHSSVQFSSVTQSCLTL